MTMKLSIDSSVLVSL